LYKYFSKKNNIFFLLNDGSYDSAFLSYALKDNKILTGASINPLHHSFSDTSENEMLDIIKTKIIDPFEYLYNIMKAEDQSAKTRYILISDITLVLKNLLIVYKKIYNEKLFLKPQTIIVDENQYSIDINAHSFTIAPPLADRNFKSIENYLSQYLYNTFNHGNIVYKSIIHYMRNIKKWKVFGVGLESELGKNYIGYENFISINHISDLQKVFTKRLKEIY